MINEEKWISSLPVKNIRFSNTENQLDYDKWINTIPKKNKPYSVKKYSLMTILFVCGLIFVSVIKNESRNLQKEINNLEASIDIIKFNLDQAILDNEVITSPENISKLAEEYLNINLVSYKKSQIKQLNEDTEKFAKSNEIKKEKIDKKNFTVSVKSKVTKEIEKKKTEIRKLQALYHNPKSLPGEIKSQVVTEIENKKKELKNLYNSPKEVVTLGKVGKWGAVQVVKAFLGMPIIPGK